MLKLLLFVVSIAMVIGGFYLLADELLWTNITRFSLLISGAVLAIAGACLL
jgi:hypothetical protein